MTGLRSKSRQRNSEAIRSATQKPLRSSGCCSRRGRAWPGWACTRGRAWAAGRTCAGKQGQYRASQSTSANWPRLTEAGGCPALDLALAGRAGGRIGRSLWVFLCPHRAAHEDVGVLARRRQVLAEHGLADEARRVPGVITRERRKRSMATSLTKHSGRVLPTRHSSAAWAPCLRGGHIHVCVEANPNPNQPTFGTRLSTATPRVRGRLCTRR